MSSTHPRPSRRCLYLAASLTAMLLVVSALAMVNARFNVANQLENHADQLAYRIGDILSQQVPDQSWVDAITPLLKNTEFQAVTISTINGEIAIGKDHTHLQASMRQVQTADAITLKLWSEPLSRLVMQKQLEYSAFTLLLLFMGFLVYRDGQQRLLYCAAGNHRATGNPAPEQPDLQRRISDQQATILQLQQQLARVGGECEELQSARTTMLASFSLEFRTQLNAIIGYTEMLLEDPAQLNDASCKDLQNILFAGNHLLNLINDVTDLVKIETGELQLQPEYFSVKSVVNDIVASLQSNLEHQHNKLALHLDDNTGQIFTDRKQFSRILGNMLRNACIYTAHGDIRISVNRETLRGVDYIKIELDDTGMGRPQDNINKLFKEFSYAEQSSFDGIGFDLAISRRLCHVLGGDIAITGNQHHGSSFTITLAAMMNQHIDEDSDDY